ncbi:hypothetical protein EUGRSUZ_E02445 [Eucalyptus grandis]|uniref:Tyrosine-protein kinase catalytic domain-containing protein n=2 Tax=Eucalyptus grandis TaxID=71139 RepID=A0A059C661_EUCGR|nr:hypothetical protein EUGRSUZ_E02445 [Eucalyptus grandis]
MIINAPRYIAFVFLISGLILFIPDTPANSQTYLQEGSSSKGNYTAFGKFQNNLYSLLDRLEIGVEFLEENYQGEKPVDPREFTLIRLDVIRAATGNFSDECKLGEGGFGPVYKASISRLSRTSGQGLIELKNEVILISRPQHRNLVRLVGFCLEEHEKLLIYEYMPFKSLDVFLFDSNVGQSLDWKMRLNITYVEMNPKVSNFGMARIFSINQDKANTTEFGHMAPEYAMEGLFYVKSNIFSWRLEHTDPSIKGSCDGVPVLKCIHINLLCVQEDPVDRSTMSLVVHMLGGGMITLTQTSQPAFSRSSSPSIITNLFTIVS